MLQTDLRLKLFPSSQSDLDELISLRNFHASLDITALALFPEPKVLGSREDPDSESVSEAPTSPLVMLPASLDPLKAWEDAASLPETTASGIHLHVA